MPDSGRHDAPLPVHMQTTVAGNVGRLLYAAALGVGNHGHEMRLDQFNAELNKHAPTESR